MFELLGYLILFFCFIAGFFVWGIITMPLGCLVAWLSVILVKAIKKNKEKNKEEERRMAEEMCRAEERRRAEEEDRRAENARRSFVLDMSQTGFWNFIYKGVPTKNKAETEMILKAIIRCPIIVDTNILMDSDLDCFWQDLFVQCSINNQKIIITSSVYDEVIRQKDDYNQEKRFKARLALRRIMQFSDSNLLFISDIKKTINPYAYADIDIINICEYIQNKTNQKMFSMITNDKDLIIRTRHILNEQKKGGEEETCRILSVGYTKYTEYWDEYKSMQK